MHSRSPRNRRNQRSQQRRTPAVHPLADFVSAGLIPSASALPFGAGIWASYEKSHCQPEPLDAHPGRFDEVDEECGSTL